MVVGDVMVDAYLFGRVDRISPEAPVPIVQVEKRINRLGGAANVAQNIKSMGAEPILCSVIGNDIKGKEFGELMDAQGLSAAGIVHSDTRITTTKFRVIGNKTQLLRVDEEISADLGERDEEELLGRVLSLMVSSKPDALIFQDYDKGVLTGDLIRRITQEAGRLDIPVVVDPKKKNFSAYRDATIFKPNLKELREGLNMEIGLHDQGELVRAASRLHAEMNVRIVLTTLSEDGVFVSSSNAHGQSESHIIPAHVRTIADVSGAGDTVVSLAALCLAAGLDSKMIAAISNLAGGQVCEQVGVVPVDREKLKKEAGQLF